ncbi:Phospho-N-acetylmuramoyl-pentapeptide-transferase [Alteribacillus persepolensis]|uniref:Phospho-N-acetylmuramoyl-pentapeptide-transferase n=1 Tax=Alteribacillus persepolensis TaxID=568899 RepID=A0A1G7YF31_9BACI|nr:phospho-N-acetylmuramoyl-pentapeptide-transferase [Alteribacillus persepolensis]SDG95043.1 Phospho-N-acetylmuramoyl-pentapeptide-transferase [Alteribacillus persepolensis]
MVSTIFLALVTAFILTVIFSPLFIPLLKRLKFGQSIREEGPKSHQKKGGTPTMGGVMILLAVFIVTLLAQFIQTTFQTEAFLLLLVTIGFGLIGFLDDFIKITKKRNLGLTSKQKLAGQLVVAIIFFLVLNNQGFDTSVAVPGTNWSVEFGWFYVILVIIMLVGASNAVNLTDGLDGLLAGTSAIAFGAFAVLAWNAEMTEAAVFSATIVGAVLGFLVFNAHPAKVFMGDTGSLALGGAIAAIAILTKLELLLILIGGVFVVETLSVILQVLSFKLRNKRIFKMSPIHHHFELIGWSEWRVVVTFWAVGMVCAVLGIYIEVWV